MKDDLRPEDLRREDARRWRGAIARSLWRVPFALGLLGGPVAAVVATFHLRDFPILPFSGVILALVLLDFVVAVRRQERRTRFRDPRWAALWTAVGGRARDLPALLKDVPRAVRPEADRLRVDAQVIARDVLVSLRRADLAASELSSMPAPYLPPMPMGNDPREIELYRLATDGVNRVGLAQEGLVTRVRRGEARAAAFAATLDLWRLRVLHARALPVADRVRDVTDATLEARRSLATVAAESALPESPAETIVDMTTTGTDEVEVRRP